MRLQRLVAACVLFLSSQVLSAQTVFKVEKSDQGVKVLLNGELMSNYLVAEPSPIVWPLIGPDGVKMTRDYPMIETTEGEKHDHPHHRSLWFTHGLVNGVDFWHKGGRVVHQGFGKVEGGSSAIIEASSAWKDNKDVQVLTEKRRMTFGAAELMRWIDVDAMLKADIDEVVFGDTKEGTFAIRVAETMKVDAKLGGKIVNSEGQVDGEAWGQPAKWVNYTGPINGKTYGIAMFCHPDTFNFPNRWHVRTYGLFAANPFGVHHFLNQPNPTPGVKIKKGDELKFRYRVMWHRDITDSGVLNKVFEEYSKIPMTAL
jgi:Methane oxygenase PmoA